MGGKICTLRLNFIVLKCLTCTKLYMVWHYQEVRNYLVTIRSLNFDVIESERYKYFCPRNI